MYHTVIGGSGTQQIIRSYFPKTSCYSVYFKLLRKDPRISKFFKSLSFFRDKKKAYMDEMEQLVSGLRAEQARLRADNAALTANNQRLLQENLALREENTLLATRLSCSQPQLSFTDDLNVEAASFVVATSSLDDDEDILLSPTSCNSSPSSSATAVVAPAAPVVAQLPEPAVLTPLQQEQNVRPAAVAAATECPPPLSSDHALSPKGLTTGPAAGPWWALQMMLCYSALWTTMCLAVSAATMTAKPSASASMKSPLSAPSPSLPLKKRPGGRAWWEEMLLKPPPLADPPPD